LWTQLDSNSQDERATEAQEKGNRAAFCNKPAALEMQCA